VTISLFDGANLRRRTPSVVWVAALAIAAALCLLPHTAHAGSPAKNVLIIRGESPELPASRVLIDGIESALRKSQTEPPEFYLEALDAPALASSTTYESRLASLLDDKYRDTPLDLVVAFTEPAVRFVLRERPALFPNTPLLFGFVDRRLIGPSTLPPQATLVSVELNAAATLRLALRAHPGAHRVLVAAGASRFDRGWLSITRDQLREFDKGVTIAYDADSTRDDLLKHVAALPPETIVLYTSMTRDAGGHAERPVDVLESLRAVARAPIYGLATSNLGHGIVGGSLIDFERHARDMGLQAARLLAGERPAPAVITPSLTAMDWSEMQRFGIQASALPEGVFVANRRLGLWERDRRGIAFGGLIVFVETALIVALVRVARRRRDAQGLLRARVDFDSSLLALTVAVSSAPPDRTASTLERELTRLAPSLGIDRVRRWNVGDAEWDAGELSASQPIFRRFGGLPADLQRELNAVAWRSGWALAIPLGGGGVVFGAVFCICRGDVEGWRAGFAELHILGTTVANVLERKRAEGQLEQSSRLRGSILESLPANVAVLDRDGRIVGVNRSWEAFARDNGITSTEAIGPGARYRDACLAGIRAGSEGAAQALAMIDAACRGEFNPTPLTYRADSPDEKRWFEMTVVPLRRPEGGAIVTHLDVSAQKTNETALRESEDRFRRMAEALPLAIWMSEADGQCSYVNQQWLLLTGRTFDQEAGTGWLDSVHPADRDGCRAAFSRALGMRQPFEMEYRVRRFDGEYRWLLDTGMPRYGSDEVFHGFVGGCIDITDRKNAEQTLRDVNRRLILAQEEERKRIARELHDHLSQQLALLAIDLQQISMAPPKSVDALRDALQAAWARTAEIASDVHGMSHRLHPSKIEALGLVATMRAHCRDVSRQGLAVQFFERNIPDGVPPDVSLCLFRVLEEAITNVARHSGAREASVIVEFDTDVVLRVFDKGRGFPTGRIASNGLGLVSMRERVEALGGQLKITSRPGRGTTVEARVPAPGVSSSTARQSAESA
jgi:PAS domain S-box-containing protein